MLNLFIIDLNRNCKNERYIPIENNIIVHVFFFNSRSDSENKITG